MLEALLMDFGLVLIASHLDEIPLPNYKDPKSNSLEIDSISMSNRKT